MRVLVKLVSNNQKITLPVGFASCLQGFIYANLPEQKAGWLHDEGFTYEKRRFKLFVYSSILERGQYDKEKGRFYFPGEISFYISSPVYWILTEFARTITGKDSLILGANKVLVSSVEILPSPKISESSVILDALTPIEVHSTFKEKGKNKTHYYSPAESEFSSLINSNLQKKWTAFTREDCPHECSIVPSCEKTLREKITYFDRGPGRIVIKGWTGRFKLEGPADFLQFAYHAGLGSKNSQGYGMWDVVG